MIMSTEITSADIVMNGYENFEELISGICNAAKGIPNGFREISASVYVTYPSEDAKYEYTSRSMISINASTIEEVISELRKLTGCDYTRVTLDVSLEKSCNGPKECHTCIYSNETPHTYENYHNSNK